MLHKIVDAEDWSVHMYMYALKFRSHRPVEFPRSVFNLSAWKMALYVLIVTYKMERGV